MLLKNGNAAEKMKTRNAATTQSSKMRRCSFLNDFDSEDAMETACQAQATTRKFAHQIMTAKATRRRVALILYGVCKRKAAVPFRPPLTNSPSCYGRNSMMICI